MFSRLATVSLVLGAIAAGLMIVQQTAAPAAAHCQVPCGIYDDPARIQQLYEDATTIEKAMGQMADLAAQSDAQSRQQFVRWTHTKELHATRIIDVVSEYFLTQKLKPVAPGTDGYAAYLKSLAQHHAVMVAAMKCKQNVDTTHVAQLRAAIGVIEHTWDPDHDH